MGLNKYQQKGQMSGSDQNCLLFRESCSSLVLGSATEESDTFPAMTMRHKILTRLIWIDDLRYILEFTIKTFVLKGRC